MELFRFDIQKPSVQLTGEPNGGEIEQEKSKSPENCDFYTKFKRHQTIKVIKTNICPEYVTCIYLIYN